MTLRGGNFWDPGSQLRKFRPGKVAVLRSQNRTGPGRGETSDPHNPHLHPPAPPFKEALTLRCQPCTFTTLRVGASLNGTPHVPTLPLPSASPSQSNTFRCICYHSACSQLLGLLYGLKRMHLLKHPAQNLATDSAM